MGGFLDSFTQGMRVAGDPAYAAQLHDERQKLKTAPLSQAIAADQQRLTSLKEGTPEYDQVVNRMALNIGQLRTIYGDTAPHDHPGRLAETVNMIRQHLKLGGKTPEQLQADQTAKVGAWNAQNKTEASQYATGALPYEQTAEGQKLAEQERLRQESERSNYQNFKGPGGDIIAVDLAHQQPPPGYVKAGAEPTKPPVEKPKKGLKALEQGGVAYGIDDQDAGVQYLPSQLGPNGNAPPEAKEIWKSIQDAQKAKAAEIDKKDKMAAARLGAALGNMGTWTMAEDGQGRTVLYNTKTGETREAPAGLRKSGYFAKQVAPLQAASLNIKSYMDNKVFDGAGDLALQHEFFTATQPSTGFRMTKVQQDILQDSRNWIESWEAKALHATTGQWFTEKQRAQIAQAAQEAIDAKMQVLQSQDASPEGPKTKALKDKRTGGSGDADVDEIVNALKKKSKTP